MEFIETISNNWEIIVFILPFVWGFYELFQKQKAQIEIKKLQAELELGNHQKILNDKKFRDSYQGFTDLIIDTLMEKKSKEEKNSSTFKSMVDFMKTSLLFAGPKTMSAFGTYMKNTSINNRDSKEVLTDIENVILAMREDLKVGNDNLKKGDILQVFINEDIKVLLNEENENAKK